MRRLNLEDTGVPDGGAYVLVLRQGRPHVEVRVGALGVIAFGRGFYCYVGSARNGLRARLARHLRRGGKRLHWHVDYLRQATQPAGALAWAEERADECALSRQVARLAQGSVPGFGCSDCRCRSHLHYFRADPTRRLRGASSARLVEVPVGPAGT